MKTFKPHLMTWMTGVNHGIAEPSVGAAAVLVQDDADVVPLLENGWAGPQSVVFAPAGADPEQDAASATRAVGAGLGDAARLVRYRGCPLTSAGELEVGEDFYVQVQPYGIAGFLTVLGPTLVRIADDADAESFLDDADTALRIGTFPETLLHPLIQLADVAALSVDAAPGDGPARRLFVDRDHTVRVSPFGDALGDAASGRQDRPGARTNGLTVSPELLRAVGERPWLGRYLMVARALQTLTGRGYRDLVAEGFGDHGRPDGDAAPGLRPADAPVLAWNGDHCFVVLPGSGRAFSADRSALADLERRLSAVAATDPSGGPLCAR